MMLAAEISSVKIPSVGLGTWQSEPGLVGQAVEVAIKLCLMARDMDMETRVAAFNAIGNILTVSEDIMLQTLSKKALSATKEKNYPGQYTAKVFKIPASATAFTFVHGLEDEFYQVRRSVCHALQMLTVLSAEFAGMVVHRLMDMLNDDSEVVRLQALQTLHHMAINDHLKLEESHLDLASMIWIIGEYAERIDNADEHLESFVETFSEEPLQVQLQLLTTTVKLFLKKPTEGPQQMIQMTVRDRRTCNVEFQPFFVLGEGQKKFSSRRTMASIVKPPSQEMVLRPPSLHR